MSETWPSESLEQLVEPDSPITYGVVKPGEPGEVAFVRGGDIADGRVLVDQLRTISAEVSRQYTRTLLRGGELLISLVGQPGQVAVASTDLAGANIARQVGLIRLSQQVLPSFVSYFLRSPDGMAGLDARTGGSVQQVINLGDLREVQVPVPDLNTQRQIVAILDEALEAIATAKANAERNLRSSRELFTNGLDQVFSEVASRGQRVALERIGTTQTGSTPSSSDPENFGDHLPFVKPGDFNRDGSITFDNEGLSEAGASKARRVKANSALMVCIGATIGKAGFSEREIATNQQVNSWTPTADVSAKFIYYQMTTSDFQRRVRQSAGQATLPIINKSKWSALTVVVPSTLDEQSRIVSSLDSLLAKSMNLEAVYERKLAALDELKQSLLHQAFTGALTARSADQQWATAA